MDDKEHVDTKNGRELTRKTAEKCLSDTEQRIIILTCRRS